MSTDNVDQQLVSVIETDSVQKAEDLLTQGASPNAQDQWGNVALIQALRSSRFNEMIKLLIKHKADVNIRDKSGNTALIQAARKDQVGAVRLLIEAGADLNLKDNKGVSALAMASALGKFGSMHLLINSGADLNSLNNERATPLIEGVGRLEVVKILIEAGADSKIKDNSGKTALDYAQESARQYGDEHRRVVDYLKSHSGGSGLFGSLSKLFSKSATPDKGWVVIEKWNDLVSMASPQRDTASVQQAIDKVKSDILARGDLPFGGYIVFATKENADRIAQLLKASGCPKATVQPAVYNKTNNKWRSADLNMA